MTYEYWWAESKKNPDPLIEFWFLKKEKETIK